MGSHNGVRNLVWVWTAASPGSGTNGRGSLFDFFPGLLYADALSIKDPQQRGRSDAALSTLGVGKVVGVELSGLPAPEIAQQKWSWFLLDGDQPASPERDEALRKLYADPRVLPRYDPGAKTGASK